MLIKWSHMPTSLATWENLVDLQRRFPKAPAWGQAGSFAGGVSAFHLLTLLKEMGLVVEAGNVGPVHVLQPTNGFGPIEPSSHVATNE